MALFSERYGYTKPSDVIIRERITPEIQNAICNCIDNLIFELSIIDRIQEDIPYANTFRDIEIEIHVHYFNQLNSTYKHGFSKEYFQDSHKEWYIKLDILEIILKRLRIKSDEYKHYARVFNTFKELLNYEFNRLNFGYHIIESQITEITSEHEIKTIENAIQENKDNIREHLSKALELYSKRPVADYRNSIKESISAVEAISRNITGENVLNFKKMEEKGVVVPTVLRKVFECLYGYTNDKTTGIRHALMEDTNAPQAEEALFMLVSCSAFINYLNKKIK